MGVKNLNLKIKYIEKEKKAEVKVDGGETYTVALDENSSMDIDLKLNIPNSDDLNMTTNVVENNEEEKTPKEEIKEEQIQKIEIIDDHSDATSSIAFLLASRGIGTILGAILGGVLVLILFLLCIFD